MEEKEEDAPKSEKPAKSKRLTGAEERKLAEDYQSKPARGRQPPSPEEADPASQREAHQEKKQE